MANDTLAVWHQPTPPATRCAGLLWRDEHGRMGFRYDAEWQHDGFPLSLQLPLATVTFAPADGAAHRFFANLLPEGDARIGLARSLALRTTISSCCVASAASAQVPSACCPPVIAPGFVNPRTAN